MIRMQGPCAKRWAGLSHEAGAGSNFESQKTHEDITLDLKLRANDEATSAAISPARMTSSNEAHRQRVQEVVSDMDQGTIVVTPVDKFDKG